MKLLFKSVKFKNFLSFGSKWQEIDFLNGINIITGKNGSGKSSCMETIPFALFGRTHKDIKKADLLNWKNRKALEVQLEFIKNDDTYRIIRSIKPDNFEVYRNDTLLEKLSHVKDYQAQLEDIIGTNFQVFCSLIHSNINSSMPIFSMSKPDKRKFIERIFGLSVYSDIVEKCNEKLQSVNNKLREMDMTVKNAYSIIEESKSHIAEINKKLKSMKSSSLELTDLRAKLDEMLYTAMNETAYNEMVKNINNLQISIDCIDSTLSKVRFKKLLLVSKMKDIKKTIPNEIECDVTEDVQELYEINNKQTNEKQKQYRTVEESITKTKYELAELQRREKLLNDSICPVCGREVNEDIRSNVSNDISALNGLMYKLNDTKVIVDKELNDLLSNGHELLNKIEEFQTYRDNKETRQQQLGKLDKYKRAYTKISKCYDDIDVKKTYESNRMSLLSELYERESNDRRAIDKLTNEIKNMEGIIALEESNRNELKAIISTDTKRIEQKEGEIAKCSENTKKFNNIKDYLDYIKVICKDENIKSYAISSIIPALTKNTNKYLSDVGRQFYLQIDNWLEPTIKGPGISSGTYENLSSGEAKSVDLSLQNAFLDIARIQAGVYPDILIMDELLDSSVDNDSLSSLLQIVMNKQIEDNSKVYIISHRDSVEEIGSANTLRLVKEGGYSKIV
jgi:DNA repair protein SbcC/Rad50